MRDYELVVILNPHMEQEQVNAAVQRIHQVVAQNGGEVTKRDDWGVRPLAYPIRHLRQGNYVVAQFRLDPSKTRVVEDNLRLSEEVLRHLLVKVGG